MNIMENILVPLGLVILWIILCNYWKKKQDKLEKEKELLLDEIEEMISNHQKYLKKWKI